MNMTFKRQLFNPQEVKEMYPATSQGIDAKKKNDRNIKEAFSGKSDKLILVIGPCSADREDSVVDYISRLRPLQEKVEEKIIIIPRIYTNKPRTTGAGYKGMLHQPNPLASPDILKGLIAIRKLHLKALTETGFSCADEMLYPENHQFLSDLLSYVAVGARSVEDQQHRLTASGLDIPVGMKNPTSGDMSVMMNSIRAAQSGHTFIYRDWEVESKGNPFTHAILRGYVDNHGTSHPNYHYEDLKRLVDLYDESPALHNPAVIVDCNHSNSGKKFKEQIRIAKEVLHSISSDSSIKRIVRGLMIESYIEEGAQGPDEGIYGKSITDPCLGWHDTERLILELADLL
ncbi:MAG TPA: 3-deoxy-7-phosphoheptulonate synthase [Bacteroidaceae bacterium]|nr:MAG: Phospho-2-dehydro-3-deoxyheptonate aldolase, Tyr-sensitive [Bacteroidetes bacterium ADurb.BinA104]HPB03710.1 3-deoxy-7-phosphoheptulonate synthase [Bacteroidaceae bacterium]